MANFSDIAKISQQPDFRGRVQYALTVAAVNVYAESTLITGHVARAAFAVKVLQGQYSLQAAVLGVLTNVTIAAEATVDPGNAVPDADIQFSINSIYNLLAGA